jgi:SET domain-containing protein
MASLKIKIFYPTAAPRYEFHMHCQTCPAMHSASDIGSTARYIDHHTMNGSRPPVVA